MKLDRTDHGRGKYAIVELRKVAALEGDQAKQVKGAIAILEAIGVIEYGEPKTHGEFFVLRLKDQFAGRALRGYEQAIREFVNGVPSAEIRASYAEYAGEIGTLADRAGGYSPFAKLPD